MSIKSEGSKVNTCKAMEELLLDARRSGEESGGLCELYALVNVGIITSKQATVRAKKYGIKSQKEFERKMMLADFTK